VGAVALREGPQTEVLNTPYRGRCSRITGESLGSHERLDEHVDPAAAEVDDGRLQERRQRVRVRPRA
jgi:hypothetical protein